MYISIIVPVYNEERTIAAMLERLLRVNLGRSPDIIVVNDGSTDHTRKVIEPYLSRVQYIEHPKNRGKGAALRSAIPLVKGEAVIVQDADLEYSPEDIPKLVAALRSNQNLTAIYGSRNLAPTGRGYRTYFLGVWFLTALVNFCFGTSLTDSYTCYKLIRSGALKLPLRLRTSGFEIEMEITARLLKKGGCIGEIPIAYHPRTKAEGKKIRASDGLRGLLTLFGIRFGGF